MIYFIIAFLTIVVIAIYCPLRVSSKCARLEEKRAEIKPVSKGGKIVGYWQYGEYVPFSNDDVTDNKIDRRV